MAIIEKKAIISPEAEQPFDKLLKQYDLLIAKNNELVNSSTNLQKAFTQITQSQTSDGAEAKKLVDINQKLIKNNTDLTALQKQRLKVEEQINQVFVKNLAVKEKDALILEKGKVRLAENNKLLKAQAKEALGLTGAYDKLAKKTLEAQKNLKNIAVEFGVGSKQAKAAQKEFDKFEKQLSKVNKAAKDGHPFIGRYTDALKGFGKQLLGAFGIVGGIQLLIDGFKSLIETSKQVNDITQKLKSTFDLTKKEAKAYAADILAISDTFDQDYNEVLNSAITVSKELGISVGEATKFIEEGFLKGSDNSGQFLDILKEYPTQFKAAGIDAQTMFSIINQQVKEGIYSDKGVDAIKEGGLRLRENTKAVQEALAPLDDFTKAQIKQEVAAGNSFKAIQLVSKALSDNSLTAAQTQAIIADVFGGPGEDAGLRYLQMLKDVKGNLSDVAVQATESEQASLRLNKEWDKFVAGVSDSDGIFSKVWATLKNLLAGAIAGVAKLLDLINGADPAKALRELNDIDLTGEEIYKRKKTQAIETLITQGKYNDAVKLANKILKEGVITQKEYDELIKKQVKGTKELTAAEKELIKEEERRANISNENKGITAINPQVRAETIGIEQELASEIVDIRLEKLKELNENIADEQKRQFDAELARVQELEDAKREIKEAAIDAGTNYAIEATNSIVDHNLAKTQDEIEAEKDLLKNQLDKGLISEAAYNQKIRDLNNKSRVEEAKADKKKALYDIAIQTAVAVVKALPNLLKVASTIALGSIQALAVAARPIPRFAKGTKYVPRGNNPIGTDTIPAMVNEGERIIPTDLNKQIGNVENEEIPTLINKGLMFEQGLNRKPDYNGLIYKQLGRLNRTNEQILQANENAVYQYEDNGVKFIVFANGRKKTRFA